jgi:hypothetical protein
VFVNLGGDAWANSVSRPAAASCIVGGYHKDGIGRTEAFVGGTK